MPRKPKPLTKSATVKFRVHPETKERLRALQASLPAYGPMPTVSDQVEALIERMYWGLWICQYPIDTIRK